MHKHPFPTYAVRNMPQCAQYIHNKLNPGVSRYYVNTACFGRFPARYGRCSDMTDLISVGPVVDEHGARAPLYIAKPFHKSFCLYKRCYSLLFTRVSIIFWCLACTIKRTLADSHGFRTKMSLFIAVCLANHMLSLRALRLRMPSSVT